MSQKPPKPLDPADVRRCQDLLESIVADRSLLLGLSDDLKVGLLKAAGQVSRPDRDALDQLCYAKRRTAKKERSEAAAAKDRGLRATTGIRAARHAPVYLPPAQTENRQGASSGRKLERAKNCYVCKQEFVYLHEFYDALCMDCAEHNYLKRFQSADLKGRYAVITGSRVKIGYQAALMLLRAGAHVLSTTRFPHDAAQRYAREPDYLDWADRLHVYGLDLRHAPSVELFAQHACATLPRLDFLINNAAQTVRRPAGWYSHLLAAEDTASGTIPAAAQSLLAGHNALKNQLVTYGQRTQSGIGLTASAALSQLAVALEDRVTDPALFPEGQLDADLQQIDRRRMNSWRMVLSDVPTPELIEVQLVNAIAPFILCGHLKPLMVRVPTRDKHVVNVTAMEGIFSRGTKTDKHPHTNMAKAALNMMTVTSAPDYLKDGIHMNAVDTGWVTDEDPEEHAQRKKHELDFQPPLDIVDGAARILDPIFSGHLTGNHVSGKFLKDYAPSTW